MNGTPIPSVPSTVQIRDAHPALSPRRAALDDSPRIAYAAGGLATHCGFETIARNALSIFDPNHRREGFRTDCHALMDLVLPVLALSFATPALLWGLGLAAIPVVIHWLTPRRYRETPWAAMQFLQAALKRQSRWAKLDHWLLLLLRTVTIAAAAIGLAGPLGQAVPATLPTTQRTQRLLIVDASLSLSAREGESPRWSRLQALVETVLAKGQPGDLWQLLRIAGTEPTVLIGDAARVTAPVLEEIRQQAVTQEAGRVALALRSALALLERSTAAEQRELHLLTDAQRTAWRPSDEAGRSELRSLLQQLSRRARIVWHDVSTEPLGNTAIVDLHAEAPVLFPGQMLRVRATLRQFAGKPEARRLQWLVDDRVAAAETLNLAPGDERTVEFSTTVTASGPIRVEARLDEDSLPADDRRGLIVTVRESLPVLLVDGKPSPQAFENGTDLIRLALLPSQRVGGGIQPTVIAESELLSTELARFDVVFLADVPLFSERDAQVLQQYVAQGGALVIGLGPQARPDNYQLRLGSAERPLLPATVGDVVGNPQQRDASVTFTGDDFRHPIVAAFRGNPNTGFDLARTFAYRRLLPVPDRGTVALTFDSGDPAIVEGRFGRGRVVLVATSLDRSWSAWPVWGHSFVPMMQDLVKTLLVAQSEARTVRVGEPLQWSLPDFRVNETLTVRLPGQEPQPFLSRVNRPGEPAVWESTPVAGFYALQRSGAASQPTWFAVNIDPVESDLQPLSPAELRNELLSGVDAVLETELPTDRPVAASLSDVETQAGETARWWLAAVALFLCVEPFLAWQRSVGWMVLAGLLSLGLAGLWAGNSGTLSVAVVLTILAVVRLTTSTTRAVGQPT